jgi:hypothetical protein
MIRPAKIAVAMVALAFCSFALVLLALNLKSRIILIIAYPACIIGILGGVISVFITIFHYLKSRPKK